MINKLRRKLAKWIAPKPVSRKKKEKYNEPFEYMEYLKNVNKIVNDKSYQKNIRHKQATLVVSE